MKSEHRIVFRSVKTRHGWAVKRESAGEPIEFFDAQADAEKAAVNLARLQRGTSKVIFHKEDGEIREEHTYGMEPREVRG